MYMHVKLMLLYIFFIQVRERPLRRPWQLYKLFLSLSAALPTHWWISVHMQVSWKCCCLSAALIDREAEQCWSPIQSQRKR